MTPGSDQVYKTIERDGLLQVFTQVGATVLANACGPCIGQWKRKDLQPGQVNSIVTSYNRNFRKRNDGSPDTMAFIGSPELVTAAAFAGSLSFDPERDSIDGFKFENPSGDELPSKGYVYSTLGVQAPPETLEARKAVAVAISKESERLSFLDVFEPWDGRDMENMLVLLKAEGKCTTDHISQAGPWLKYRGHLAKISDNCFLGAINAFSGEAGKGKNILSGEDHVLFPEIAKDYKAKGRNWVVFGEENYGEGSSREHAAMSPRFLGGRAVIVKSFARIHETNLKKQGVLPLTFADPADYDKVEETDVVTIRLGTVAPDSPVEIELKKASGAVVKFAARHTMTAEQIEWFKAGSALNVLRPH